MMAPVHGPNVYPDKTIRVEYNGMGAFGLMVNTVRHEKLKYLRIVVIKMREKRIA